MFFLFEKISKINFSRFPSKRIASTSSFDSMRVFKRSVSFLSYFSIVSKILRVPKLPKHAGSKARNATFREHRVLNIFNIIWVREGAFF